MRTKRAKQATPQSARSSGAVRRSTDPRMLMSCSISERSPFIDIQLESQRRKHIKTYEIRIMTFAFGVASTYRYLWPCTINFDGIDATTHATSRAHAAQRQVIAPHFRSVLLCSVFTCSPLNDIGPCERSGCARINTWIRYFNVPEP